MCSPCYVDLLFYGNIELSDSDVSDEENGGDTSYLIDSSLDDSELFSLSEIVVSELQMWN